MVTLRSGLTLSHLIITDKLSPGATVASTVEMMRCQTKHLAGMVDDLLDVIRISRGKIELKRKRVNRVETVGQAIE